MLLYVCAQAKTNVHMPVIMKKQQKGSVNMHRSSWCNPKVLNACSVLVTLTFKLWWCFFLLFGSPSARLVQLLWVFLLYFPPILFHLFFNSSHLYGFSLKTGTLRHCVWMCSDTSSSQGMISQGKIDVWHVYILFPYSICVASKAFPLFCFTLCCKLDICWGKTDADPFLTPKEEWKV